MSEVLKAMWGMCWVFSNGMKLESPYAEYDGPTLNSISISEKNEKYLQIVGTYYSHDAEESEKYMDPEENTEPYFYKKGTFTVPYDRSKKKIVTSRCRMKNVIPAYRLVQDYADLYDDYADGWSDKDKWLENPEGSKYIGNILDTSLLEDCLSIIIDVYGAYDAVLISFVNSELPNIKVIGSNDFYNDFKHKKTLETLCIYQEEAKEVKGKNIVRIQLAGIDTKMLSMPECAVSDFTPKVVKELSEMSGMNLSGLAKKVEDWTSNDWDVYWDLLNLTYTKSGSHIYPPTDVVNRHLK